jgi:hypothetical protein
MQIIEVGEKVCHATNIKWLTHVKVAAINLCLARCEAHARQGCSN